MKKSSQKLSCLLPPPCESRFGVKSETPVPHIRSHFRLPNEGPYADKVHRSHEAASADTDVSLKLTEQRPEGCKYLDLLPEVSSRIQYDNNTGKVKTHTEVHVEHYSQSRDSACLPPKSSFPQLSMNDIELEECYMIPVRGDCQEGNIHLDNRSDTDLDRSPKDHSMDIDQEIPLYLHPDPALLPLGV